MLATQTPTDTPQPPVDQQPRRKSRTTNMTSLFTQLRHKLNTPGRKSPKSSPERSIPPEPVQQAPEGNFSDRDAGPVLQQHNLARANKQCPKLEWSSQLAKDAQGWAEKLAEEENLEHARETGQGENLFMSSGDAGFEEAVEAWLGEEKRYNGEKVGEGELGEWGHFSQCLWSKTTHVGMGKATSKSGATYVVARYSPPGNVSGEKPF